jgi:pimeloyl-ACP methyl ester carboxylesterase
MLGMERALVKAGYKTLNLSYPSTRLNLLDSSAHVARQIEAARLYDTFAATHFVAHSLGGLVTQCYLQNLEEKDRHNIGRVVMLGTPNKGSEVAEYIKNFPPYRWMFGPVGQELSMDSRKVGLAHPFYQSGIIAGNVGWPYFLSNILVSYKGNAHDGRVSVENTKLPRMTDHITLSLTHGLMCWSRTAQDQTIYFLNNGVFQHE